MLAHHLDRAVSLPALHYLLPMRAWDAGLNHLLLAPGSHYNFEPFDEVVATRFRKSVTRNLNGMDFSQFSEIVRQSPLRPKVLKLMPLNTANGAQRLTKMVYRRVYEMAMFREFLAGFILLVATLPE